MQRKNRFKILTKILLLSLNLLVIVPVVQHLSTPEPVNAANYQMKTGYYIGNGANGLSISGLGFQPDFVMIKSGDNGNEMVFKTSAMPGNTTSYTMALAADTGTMITLNSDGFTLSNAAGVNTTNFSYHWVAFGGSDCSATGNFCVGSYTGNATNPRSITVGFEPAFTMIKANGVTEANFKTTQMAANEGNYFTTTLPVTNGDVYGASTSTAFTVGTINNTNAEVYYYVAFENTTGIMNTGQYTGNAADGRNITGVGFKPNFVILKNSNSATSGSRRMNFSTTHHYGDAASWMGVNNSNNSNVIQELNTDGFQVGTDATSNETGSNVYWMAWGGSLADEAQNEPFDMALGTYTGTGVGFSITDLEFAPDLVIIKDTSTNFSVFRTSIMGGDATAYLGTNVADFTGGITSLNSDGFTIGTNTIVNTNTNTYHWQAFGNAWDPHTNTGSDEFAIGAYRGNGVDNRLIDNLVFTPDFFAVKNASTAYAVWKTPSMPDDINSYFRETASGTNVIQRILAGQNTVELGSSSPANNSGVQNRWFAFKEGSQFNYGSYVGDGVDNRSITGLGFQPDLAMVKRSTSTGGVFTPSNIDGDSSLFYGGTAAAADNIQALQTDGFQVGTNANVNALTGDYYYAAWGVQSGACTWTGTDSTSWNDGGNWTGVCSGAGVPGDTDSLIFPVGGLNRVTNNNLTGLNLNSLTFQTDYTVGGSAFTVSNGMSGTAATTMNAGVTLDGTGDQTWTFTGAGLTSNGGIVLAQNLDLSGVYSIVGTISGTGNLEVLSNSNVSATNGNTFIGNVTLGGIFTAGGGLALGNSANIVTINQSGTLELENGINVQQDIVINTGGGIRNSFASNTLSGDITLNDVLLVDAAVSTLNLTGIISGTGSIVKENTATLRIAGSSSNTLTGYIQVVEGTIELAKTGGATAGENILIGNSSGAADSATLTYIEDDQVDNDGLITVASDGLLNLNAHADFVNALDIGEGRVDIADGNLVVFDLEMIGGLIETGVGELGVANAMSLSSNTTQAVIDGGLDLGSIMGGIDIIGANGGFSPDAQIHANLIGNSDIFINGGDIEFDGDNSMYTGNLTINGGTVAMNGDNILTDIAMSGGQLFGTGPIGNLTVYSGQVHPGNSPGILHIEGDMALSSADILFFELDGTTVGTQYDRINASDVFINDATISVDPSVIFTLGTEFVIITGDSISGIFDGLAEGEVFEAGGQYFEISYLDNQVTLTVVAEPEPSPVLSNTGIQVPVTAIFVTLVALTSSLVILKRRNTF
jgi:hypothetical protein